MIVTVCKAEEQDKKITLYLPMEEERLDLDLARIGCGSLVEKDIRICPYIDSLALTGATGTLTTGDELNFLARRMESLNSYERLQVECICYMKHFQQVKDIINATFQNSKITILAEGMNWETFGRRFYMDREGCCPVENTEIDFGEFGKEQILSGNGMSTPFGIVFTHSDDWEEFYDGKHFPYYRYETESVAVLDLFREGHEYLYLPTTEAKKKRAYARLGISDLRECQWCLTETAGLGEKTVRLMEECRELQVINGFCQAASQLGWEERKQLETAVCNLGIQTLRHAAGVAVHLGRIEILPEVTAMADYGKYAANLCQIHMPEEYYAYFNLEAFARNYLEKEKKEWSFCISEKGFIRYNEAEVRQWKNFQVEKIVPLRKPEGLRTIKFFYPLEILASWEEDGWETEEIDSCRATIYEEKIKNNIQENIISLGQRGLMKYADPGEELAEKVFSVIPGVESREGYLYGTLACEVYEDYTEEDELELKRFWHGQRRHGWGEEFRERGVSVEGGYLYVRFQRGEIQSLFQEGKRQEEVSEQEGMPLIMQ